jgi:hypothetical protein
MPKVRASPGGRGRLEPNDKSFYKECLYDEKNPTLKLNYRYKSANKTKRHGISSMPLLFYIPG